MNEPDQTGLGWTVVLRRQTAQIVEGQAEGGYTDAYELVCCQCGDHPGTSYRELSAELRQIRGPYPIAAGIAAYERHVSRHHRPRTTARAARRDYAAHPSESPAACDRGLAGETVTAEMGASIWQRLLIRWMRSMRPRCGAGT